jgi:hypothetical protein
VKKYRDLWEAIITNVMETLAHGPGQFDTETGGNHCRVGWVDDSAIDLSSLAVWNDSGIVSPSHPDRHSTELRNGPYASQGRTEFSDHFSHDFGLVDHAQFDAGQFICDIQDSSVEASGTVPNQPQVTDNEYFAEVDHILSEDIWAGDRFSSQMLKELVSKASGGEMIFDMPPSQVVADYLD